MSRPFSSHSARYQSALRQIAALPYRMLPDGSAEVLLITSRETRRWVVPKGNMIAGLQPHQAAAREAFEEAGISGLPCPVALGNYSYEKRRRNGSRPAEVEVFPLAVLRQYEDWPEKHEREQRWFSLSEASEAVDEPELKALILGFREPPRPAGPAEKAMEWVRSRTSNPMLPFRWLQAMLPKRSQFFDLFEDHAETIVEGGDALAHLLQGGETIAEYAATLQQNEYLADEITREVLQDVRRVSKTPFERSAITSLIGSMDDTVDQMNLTAKAIIRYETNNFPDQMRDMSSIIVEAARITAEAMPLLRSLSSNAQRLHTLTERVVRMEEEADDIYEAGLKALFVEHREKQSLDFFIGHEIYGHLEKVVNSFEDIANEIQGLVIADR